MVAPCDKYQGLVFGPDGQTVTDPYGMIPTLEDYSEWREVAKNIIDRAEAELLRGFELYGALPEEWDAKLIAITKRWDDMGGFLEQSFEGNFFWGSSIDNMVSIAKDAACELGVIEARIVKMGGGTSDEIPTPPDTGTTGGGKGSGKAAKGGGIGMVLLLGLVVAFASSRRKR